MYRGTLTCKRLPVWCVADLTIGRLEKPPQGKHVVSTGIGEKEGFALTRVDTWN